MVYGPPFCNSNNLINNDIFIFYFSQGTRLVAIRPVEVVEEEEVITKPTFTTNILQAGVEGAIMISVTRVASEGEADINTSSIMTLVTHQEVGAMAQIQAVMVAIPREFKISAAINMGEEISAIHLEEVTSGIH